MAYFVKTYKNQNMPPRTDSSYQKNNFSWDFEKIIAEVKPKLIVEFGIGNGYSLQYLRWHSKDTCMVHAYDLFEDFPYNTADFKTITKMFARFKDNIKIEKMDFYKGHHLYKDNEIDILHIDVANNADVYKFALENYWSKIAPGGAMVLEGGSAERDEVEWMNKYQKPKINPFLKEISNQYEIEIIEKFPSLTIIRKTFAW